MKILGSSPCRLSLLGGGTDISSFSNKYGGITIGMAINIRQNIEINTSGYEIVPLLDIIKGANPDFYIKFFEEMGYTPQSLKQRFAQPIESGIGSSAALAVTLVGVLSKASGVEMTKAEIAERAYDIEVNSLKMFGGRQDQVFSSWGGANLLIFEDKVYRYALPKDKIDKITPHLVLFNSGIKRSSSKIQDGLKEITTKQRITLNKIKELAYLGLDAIDNSDYEGLGYIMDEAWEQKKLSNAGISTREIGDLYDRAKKCGALGGKICGSGGGGHMLFITKDPEKLIAGMPIKHVPFEVDWEGLKVE